MPISPSPSNAERGFTLMEMLVVLTLLGVAAAVIAGHVDQRPTRLERDGDVARLRLAVEAARREAIRTGAPVLLNVPDLAQTARFDGAVIGSEARLRFFSDGSSNGGIVTLAGEPVLEVVWLTGEVRRAE